MGGASNPYGGVGGGKGDGKGGAPTGRGGSGSQSGSISPAPSGCAARKACISVYDGGKAIQSRSCARYVFSRNGSKRLRSRKGRKRCGLFRAIRPVSSQSGWTSPRKGC